MRASAVISVRLLRHRQLREQALGPPAGAVAQIDETVVQAERAILPKLETIGNDAVSRPMWRARHPSHRIARRYHGDAALERGPAGDDTRLVGRPGADLAEPRPRREIGVGLLGGDRLDRALDAHLAAQGLPMEQQ